MVEAGLEQLRLRQLIEEIREGRSMDEGRTAIEVGWGFESQDLCLRSALVNFFSKGACHCAGCLTKEGT